MGLVAGSAAAWEEGEGLAMAKAAAVVEGRMVRFVVAAKAAAKVAGRAWGSAAVRAEGRGVEAGWGKAAAAGALA